MLPSTQDYKISLMIGADSFRTLENVEVVMNPLYPNEPWFSTGGLAIVFKIKIDGKAYALKCFHKESDDRQFRLEKISEYIRKNPSPYWVEFEYLDDELWVEVDGFGKGYPVVLMEWIEGQTLDNYLQELCTIKEHEDKRTQYLRTAGLQSLYLSFIEMSKWLMYSPIAHGDLKHDNIIINELGQLKLVDYDGMFVPALAGMKAAEVGSPAYQHPDRNVDFFNSRLDEFSVVVFLTTIYSLYLQPTLFKEYFSGDGVLFSEGDLVNPITSNLFKELQELQNNELEKAIKLILNSKRIETDINLKDIYNNLELLNWEKERNIHQSNTLILIEEYIDKYRILQKRAEKASRSLNNNLNEALKLFFEIKNNTPSITYILPIDILINYTLSDTEISNRITLNKSFLYNYYHWVNWEDISFYYKLTDELIVEFEQLIDISKIFNNKNNEISPKFTNELFKRYSESITWKTIYEESRINLPSIIDNVNEISLIDNVNEISFGYVKVKDGIGTSQWVTWDLELIKEFKDKWGWDDLSKNKSLPWTVELIEKFENEWDWSGLSQNESLPWTIELIEKFEDEWDWSGLSQNESLPWTIELIGKFKNKWNLKNISSIKSLAWTIELIEKHEDKWSWTRLSRNYSLPWTIELIEKYENKWSWCGLSLNKSLPWTIELIEKYEDKWGWIELSANNSLPWSINLIEKFEDKWEWFYLTDKDSLPWSINLIEKFENKWWWNYLSMNRFLPWTQELIEKFKNKWEWEILSNNNSLPWTQELIEKYEDRWCGFNLSYCKSLPWSIELIERYEDIWDWSILSKNDSLPWSIEFIEKFKNKWEWSYYPYSLTNNLSLPFSLEFIERFKNKWDWNYLTERLSNTPELIGKFKNKWNWWTISKKKSLQWSIELIEKYEDKWVWSQLSRNKFLPWSLEFIEKYSNKWNWTFLSLNEGLPWSEELIIRYHNNWDYSNLNKNKKAMKFI